ncbi:hypothetical protein DKX38_012071 [Salix brachista]|uniref:Vacuolar protein-sorting-associated protein 36 n=1 Tax=Salix brachista TaxID=2182728 RepID=A0A5N5LMI9_9ROSI|nr:hypothetical protein DKX38_012071 [Salix brachista]
MFHTPRIRFQVSMHSRSVMVSLVIRWKGGIDDFLTKFWDCWKGRAWEIGNDNGGGSGYGSFSSSSGGLSSSDGSLSLMGVAGILRKEKEMWESTDKSMQEAFQDLNALMEMGSKDDMQEWLLSVGIISPVTKESAGAMYHQQLSYSLPLKKRISNFLFRYLADFVRIPLEKAGGMINLIDVCCLFNRARGTDHLYDFQVIYRIVLCVDSPVMLRKFDSGAIVIQDKSHSDEEIEVFARIKNLVSKPEALWTGINASDAAMTMVIASAMAKKRLLCRDISPDGFCFFISLFPEINSDDVHRVKDHGIYSLWIKRLVTISAQKFETSIQHVNARPGFQNSPEISPPSHFTQSTIKRQSDLEENRKRVWLGAAILEEESFIRLLEDVSNAPDTAGGLTSTITCYTAWNDSRPWRNDIKQCQLLGIDFCDKMVPV